MKKTVVQEPDHYMKRLQRHHDELRWLYMELYGNDSMFAESTMPPNSTGARNG